MAVLKRDLRDLLHPQAAFEGNLTPIQSQSTVRKRKVSAGRRVETTITIVPSAKFARRKSQEPQFVADQSQAQTVIMVVEDGMAIHGEGRVGGHLPLVMQILNAAESTTG